MKIEFYATLINMICYIYVWFICAQCVMIKPWYQYVTILKEALSFYEQLSRSNK